MFESSTHRRRTAVLFGSSAHIENVSPFFYGSSTPRKQNVATY